MAVRFVLLLSRQGKVRLAKWYTTCTQKERAKVIRDVTPMVLPRALKLCNFLDYQDIKVVYKRYASLYFVMGIDNTDNELLTLEIIHHFVEVLDRYFGNVCELDLIFNFHKAYFMLDEMMLAGELQEPSKKAITRVIEAQDQLVENAKLGGPQPPGARAYMQPLLEASSMDGTCTGLVDATTAFDRTAQLVMVENAKLGGPQPPGARA
jgi:AP-1 complex subunit sigma 1/2